ncbi:MAG: metallophosphoesterase, partial [Spirochaetia bacterium]
MSSRPFTALALAAVLLLGACAGQRPAGTPLPSDFPSVRFAVVSDLHFGEEARTLQDAPASRATLVEHSGAIFAAMCDEISAAQPDFLLVCGDMADAGEIASHQRVEQQLAVLRAGGRAEGYGERARGRAEGYGERARGRAEGYGERA